MSHLIQKERILTLRPVDVENCIVFLKKNEGAVLVGARGRMEISGWCPLIEECKNGLCCECQSRKNTYLAVKEILNNRFGKVQENSGTWTETRMKKVPDTDLVILRTPYGGIVLYQGSDGGEKGLYIVTADTTMVYRRG